MFVDLCMFPAPQMRPPIFAEEFPRPAIVGITACPPIPGKFSTFQEIAAEVQKTATILENQRDVVVIRSHSDLEKVAASSRHIGVILDLQLPPYDVLPKHLHILRKIGILFTTLTYKNEENPYGGGYMTEKPLTDAGRTFLRGLAIAGIAADVSHASHQTARDILQFARKNQGIHTIASHGGAYVVYPSPRNLPDDILVDIAKRGGIVGVYNLTFGLDSKDNSLGPWEQHITHLVRVCGNKSIVFGTDGIYRPIPENDALEQFEKMRRFDPGGQFGARYPTEPLMLNTPAKVSILRDTLLRHFKVNDVENIASDNALRFLHELLT